MGAPQLRAMSASRYESNLQHDQYDKAPEKITEYSEFTQVMVDRDGTEFIAWENQPISVEGKCCFFPSYRVCDTTEQPNITIIILHI